MDDERLFEMVETCVADAVSLLERRIALDPFAMTLEADGTPRRIDHNEPDSEVRYEILLESLRAEARSGEILAAVLLARVTIPDDYGPAVPEGIRLHIEERATAHEKIAARLLYIPYQLFKAEGEESLSVHLHHPISVGMPSEIFTGL